MCPQWLSKWEVVGMDASRTQDAGTFSRDATGTQNPGRLWQTLAIC